MTTTIELPRVHPAAGTRASLTKLVLSLVVSRAAIAAAIVSASWGIGYPTAVARISGLAVALVLIVAGTWFGLQLARQSEWETVDGSLSGRQPGWWILVRSGIDIAFILALSPLLVAGSWFDTLTPVFWGWALSLRALSIIAAILAIGAVISGIRHRNFWASVPFIVFGATSVLLWIQANPIYGTMGWTPSQIPVAVGAVAGLALVVWVTYQWNRRVAGENSPATPRTPEQS